MYIRYPVCELAVNIAGFYVVSYQLITLYNLINRF